MLLFALVGVALSASLHGEILNEAALQGSPGFEPSGEQTSEDTYERFLRYLLRPSQREPIASADMSAAKRMADVQVPYLKYKVDKRDNGVWIWMPAQGYVSVPHHQEEGHGDLSKPGKIMRYG